MIWLATQMGLQRRVILMRTIITLILMQLILASSSDAQVSGWRRHSWGISDFDLARERLLDATVFSKIPPNGPLVARRFWSTSGQCAVWVGPSKDGSVVRAATADRDVLAGMRLRQGSLEPEQVRLEAEKILNQGSVQFFERQLSGPTADYVISKWSRLVTACTSWKFPPTERDLWSLLSESSDGRVSEIDISSPSSDRNVQQVIDMAESLVEFARGKLSERDLMEGIRQQPQTVDSTQDRNAGTQSPLAASPSAHRPALRYSKNTGKRGRT